MSTAVNEVVEETQAGDASTNSEQQIQDARQQETQAAEQRKRNDAEYNWAEIRRVERELKQQNEDLRKQLAQASKAPPQEDDELNRLAEDDIITVAQAKKLALRTAKAAAEEVVRHRDAATVEDRLKLHYPDYAEVLANENIELINKTDPEFAETLALQPDPYKRVVAAYKFLKKLGVQSNATESIEKKKAMDNSQKPMSVQAVGKQSAIGNIGAFENSLTPEMKKQFWKEMQHAIKTG